jgi:hypothetical protein
VVTVIVTIAGRSICSVNSYCVHNGEVYLNLTVIVTIMTITGRSMCSANSHSINNGEVNMQC